MSTVSLQSRRLSDARDMLTAVKNLNEAIFMAAGSLLQTNPHWCNALQSVSDEVDSKLHAVTDLLDEIQKELA